MCSHYNAEGGAGVVGVRVDEVVLEGEEVRDVLVGDKVPDEQGVAGDEV